jgi:Holliday junction resolvase RusA-like endonuclease
VGRWGAYYPAKYSKWKEFFSAELRRVVEEERIEKFSGPIEVRLVLSATRPRTSKLDFPRPDVDNYAKSVLDASNKILWDDDSQIIHLHITKLWTPTACPPQIIIFVTQHRSALSDMSRARRVNPKTT